MRKPPPGAIAKAIENYDNHAVLPGDQAELVKSRIRRGPELGAPLPFSCPRKGDAWSMGPVWLSAPPIKTDRGWLFLYSNSDLEDEDEWQISAALLDLEQPWSVLANTPKLLLTSETENELTSVVNRVNFPSGPLPSASSSRSTTDPATKASACYLRPHRSLGPP